MRRISFLCFFGPLFLLHIYLLLFAPFASHAEQQQRIDEKVSLFKYAIQHINGRNYSPDIECQQFNLYTIDIKFRNHQFYCCFFLINLVCVQEQQKNKANNMKNHLHKNAITLTERELNAVSYYFFVLFFVFGDRMKRNHQR